MTTSASNAQLGNVLVLGYGKTGVALARYLTGPASSRVSSVTLVGGLKSQPDDTAAELERAGVDVRLGTEDVSGSFDLCIASPGISELSDFHRAAAAASRETIGEPEFAWRESPSRWVGITGTNGKTTTTSLTAHLLQVAGLDATCVGNIGTLATAQVPSRAEGSWFVAELSSFQLAGTSRLHPHVAVLLNITPDHLAWHGSHEAYVAAKAKVFANMDTSDVAVVGDTPATAAIIESVRDRGIPCVAVAAADDGTTSDRAFVRDGHLVVRLGGTEHTLCATDDLLIHGDHNIQNALASASVAVALGLGDKSIAQGLSSFSPLEHRIEPCGTIDGVRYVNDSKATNTDAVEQALTAFEPGHAIVLMGGHDKGTDLTSVAAAVAARAKAAVVYGEAAGRIGEALEAAGCARVEHAPHMAEALAAGAAMAEAGDVVLLSPACSSFDEFSGFEERGRTFKALVARMAEGKSE